jgi:hypothetical protein
LLRDQPRLSQESLISNSLTDIDVGKLEIQIAHADRLFLGQKDSQAATRGANVAQKFEANAIAIASSRRNRVGKGFHGAVSIRSGRIQLLANNLSPSPSLSLKGIALSPIPYGDSVIPYGPERHDPAAIP